MSTITPKAIRAVLKESVMPKYEFEEIREVAGRKAGEVIILLEEQDEAAWADIQIAASKKELAKQLLIEAEIEEFDCRSWFDRCHELAVYEPSPENAAKEASARADWDAARQKLEALK